MGDSSLKLNSKVITYILFVSFNIPLEPSIKIAYETQRDCLICHGKISPQYKGKPPFVEYGANYLRMQISKARYAPLYDYSFIEDLYPAVRYNRELKKIRHRENLNKNKTLRPKYNSLFKNYDPKNDLSDPELKIATRNQLKYFCKMYEAIEFTDVNLRTVSTSIGEQLVYFKFSFNALHLREIPNFLDEIGSSAYFRLQNDPSIKYIASRHPMHKTHQHYYKVVQEGLIHPEEFDL